MNNFIVERVYNENSVCKNYSDVFGIRYINDNGNN
jgi:hypothetical protein